MAKPIELLQEVPPDIFGKEYQQLPVLAADLDSLLVVNAATGQPAVFGPALEQFANKWLPNATANATIALFKQDFSDHLVDETNKGEPIYWADLGNYTPDILPPRRDDLENQGLQGKPDKNAIDAWLQQNYGTTLQQAESLTRQQVGAIVQELSVTMQESGVSLQANRSNLWSCLVRHLGWWGALMVFGAIGVLIIISTATGPFAVVLIVWCIAVFGGGTATIMINCALNPSS